MTDRFSHDPELVHVGGATQEEFQAAVSTARSLRPRCVKSLENARSPYPHNYKVIGEEYGSLADGGSYEKLQCVDCGRVAYSMMPD